MNLDHTAEPWRGAGRLRIAAVVAGAALLVLGVAAPAQAERFSPIETTGAETAGADEHCIAYVMHQRQDGELVLGAPDCYPTFSQAMFVASAGTWRLPHDAPVGVLGSSTAGANYPGGGTIGGESTLSSPLATHYDGFNGGGSSITVYGSTCVGFWNTWTSWDNRISSTYNGCYKTRHYDLANLRGSSIAFYGFYLWNITGFMNNRTESISYANW